ncbi:substrate-binding domain-containing protein, partial [Thermobifida sp.]|uniref:substrate-binding domain-containing protein n=1 Tax=Thermobifida sp. TaxID=2027107 RepID=UPI00257EE1BB
CYPDPEYREQARSFMQSPESGWRDFLVTTRSGAVLETSWANIRLPDDTQIGIGIDVREQRRWAARAAETRRELGVPPEAFLLVHVANFRPVKNHRLLVAAARRVLRSAGGGGPEDVGVVAYADSPVAEHAEPPMTSVNQPTELMGREMARLLVDRITGETTEPVRLVLETHLMVRESG